MDMYGKILRLFLFLSFLIGCFPSKSLRFGDPKDFEFRWCHPSVGYTIFIIAFNFFSSTNFIFHDLPSFIRISFGKNLANSISGYVDSFNFLVGDSLIRLTALFYCAKTIQLIKLMQGLGSRIELMVLSQKSWNARVTNVIPGLKDRSPVKNTWMRGVEFRRKEYSPVKVYFLFGTVIVLHMVNHSVRITDIVTRENFPVFHTFWELKGEDQIFRTVWWLNHWFAIVSYVFALGLLVVPGMQLASLFQKLKNILIRSNCLNGKVHLDGSEFCDNFILNFKMLMDGYELYLEVAGIYALILVPSSAIALGQQLHQFLNSREVDLLSHCITCFLWSCCIASVGENMQVQMTEGKEEIRNALFLDKSFPPNENFREMAQWILGWNWMFTARNLFVVKRSLMLGCFEAVMTYVIFLFQLRFSDFNEG